MDLNGNDFQSKNSQEYQDIEREKS